MTAAAARPVVAGVDGSPGSLTAARHAAYAAATRSLPLRLVHGFLPALDHGLPENPYDGDPPAPGQPERRMLTDTAERLRREWPELTVSTRQAPDGGAATLIEESRRADLVVVGDRDRERLGELLLGSVASQVTGHAHCPVLVVRPPDRPVDHPGPVIAGIDGSPAGDAALIAAAHESVRRSRLLVVAHVWWAAAVRETRETYAGIEATAMADAAELVVAAVANVQARFPGIIAEEKLMRGPDPARTLVEASREAGLLVVGARGHGGLAELLLGSVSQRLVQYARCPVLVARAQSAPLSPPG
ncbi:Nucleotide-binding universal stress protein, UspA family [Micromonospora pattaloongensis]|uniref:Nucleotide-binding universal stress protein, UspA family n=1 Tax=Micromonospora pattaloongensis TaxID=405436 RepID=A0A1H3JIG0_9ACTN|nr:universal stress protein [Micromonospora pattaloongensis]SDY39706.1 Nucleotide-binding universal stress protein, UspA family [Micromonospora pattaloongensis]